jgi:hypothetical protein
MPATAKYKRKAFRFNDGTVGLAVSLSHDEGIGRTVVEWRDVGTVGLTIRITRDKAMWYLRRQDITIRLCDASQLPLDQARYIAKQVQLAASMKRDLRDVVRVLLSYANFPNPYASEKELARFDRDTAARIDHGLVQLEKARKGPAPEAKPHWTWKRLREEFLKYKLPQLKESYRDDYKHYLELEPFKAVEDKMVCEIKLGDLERVRNAIAMTHAKSAVHRAVTQSKRMLSWAWSYQAAPSGLEDVQYEWWLRWKFEYKTNERTRSPSIDEIARTLVIAEKFQHLAGRRA